VGNLCHSLAVKTGQATCRMLFAANRDAGTRFWARLLADDGEGTIFFAIQLFLGSWARGTDRFLDHWRRRWSWTSG